MSSKKEIEKREPSSTRPVLVGALVGAGAGVVAAMLLHRRAKKQERDTMITIPEAIQLGLLVFGLFRAISALGNED
jgi:phosphate/sulfate permease